MRRRSQPLRAEGLGRARGVPQLSFVQPVGLPAPE